MPNKIHTIFLCLLILPLPLALGATDYIKAGDKVNTVTAAAQEAQKAHRNGMASPDPFAPLNDLLKQGIGLHSPDFSTDRSPPAATAPVKQAAPVSKPISPSPPQQTIKPTRSEKAGISGIPNTGEEPNNENNVQLNF